MCISGVCIYNLVEKVYVYVWIRVRIDKKNIYIYSYKKIWTYKKAKWNRINFGVRIRRMVSSGLKIDGKKSHENTLED